MKILLKIKLLSDTCLGGSNVMGGVVDTEIVTDANGIPCIPGKRIKGLFREMATEILEFQWNDVDKIRKTIEELFGRSGNEKEVIHFQTLYPEGYEEVKTFLDIAKQDKNWKEYVEKNKVLDYYTTIRSQTALEDSGIAKKNSLRMIRVVKKNHTFCGEIECPEDISKENIELLEYCAKMIRHVGMNRTRGMGNVQCELMLLNEEKGSPKVVLKKYENDYQSNVEDKHLSVRIRFLQPCVMETDYIPGGVLRGMYASKYAKYAGNIDLHKSALFRALFLENKVKFGYCWPVQKDLDGEYKLYYPTPNTFVQTKKVSDGYIYDLAGTEEDELNDVLNEKERCKVPFVNIDGEDVYHYSVKRMESHHHRRPEDRSVGHALKSKGTPNVSDGQLYSREFLCEGQEFYGEIRGPKNLLDVLKYLISSGESGYLGASRTAEYGKVNVFYEEENIEIEQVETENCLVITMVSPMVVMDEFGNDTTDAELVAKTILGAQWKDDIIIRSYCKEEMVSGYNAKWNMPIVQRNVLMPGSEIVLYGDELDEMAEELNGRSFGLYQNEGYGQILVNWHGDCESFEDAGEYKMAEEKTVSEYSADMNPKLLQYIDACLEHKVLQLCARESDTDFCYKLRKILKHVPNSHVLSGLQRIYRTSMNFEDLGKQMKDASSRAKKRNAEWFDEVYDCLFTKEMVQKNSNQEYSEWPRNRLWNINNMFCEQGNAKIADCGFDESYKNKMNQLLNGNSYQYFSEIFGRMIYDVHLDLDKGGK